jgi:hypothetical protein
MKGEGFLFKPGFSEPDRIAFDGPPMLDEMTKAIGGGYIETVPHFNRLPDGRRCVAFCDEEGKNNGLPLNEAATAIWYALVIAYFGRQPDDHLVGPVLCLTGDADFMESL